MFTEPLAAKIIKGEKTATRRVLSTNPRSPWWRGRTINNLRYPVGATFTVNPGRGVDRVAECEVTDRYRQRLGLVDGRLAKTEGFTSRLAFRDGWARINGGFDPSEKVDVVEFKLVGPDCMGCDGCGWCEGSPAWTCTDCWGTGIAPSVRGRDFVARVEKELAEAGA